MQAATGKGYNLESTYFVLFPSQVVLFWWVMALFSYYWLNFNLSEVIFMDGPDFFPWLQVLSAPDFLLDWFDCIQAIWLSRGCISTAFLIDTIVVFTIVIFFQFLNIDYFERHFDLANCYRCLPARQSTINIVSIVLLVIWLFTIAVWNYQMRSVASSLRWLIVQQHRLYQHWGILLNNYKRDPSSRS